MGVSNLGTLIVFYLKIFQTGKLACASLAVWRERHSEIFCNIVMIIGQRAAA
jgi:hypothetical protein